ncbi:MAG: efflux RND transporter periplasmic adaptor subunit [candidate division WOR-3 bacterium]
MFSDDSKEKRAESGEELTLRSPPYPLGNSGSSKKRRLALMALFVILLGGGAAGAYFYRDLLRGTKLGKWMGLEKQAEAKEVYYCPMHPDYKSDKPGDCPICNMTLVKLEPRAETAVPSGERKILYWQDPMHPQYKSDKPGKAPDCGMDLVPVYADEGPRAQELPPGTVQISPQKQQLIGVQYGEVLYQPLSKTIRTVGRLAYDETKIARIHTKIEGWIEKVYVDFTGKLVKKGQPLISLYSPELVSTQQEFLIAKRAKDYLGDNPIKEISSNALSLYESTRERLRLWDISEDQIKEIEERGAPTKTLTLYAPIDGFVLARNAFERQRITPETELYAIADLSTIWVFADIYEYEAPLIKLGQTATLTLSYFPGKTFKGKVTYIYPQLDNTTRTLKVRLEFPNLDFQLKPDMYANVELHINYGRQLAVPEEAVLDSGSEQIVFVARDGGYFEPRKVTLGQKVGHLFIVLDGVKAGERVVTSANFLIDSESQLKSALRGIGHAGHGGGAPPGGEQKAPPQPKGQPDHSQHQAPPPAADHSRHRP